jgi:hypothetical protein
MSDIVELVFWLILALMFIGGMFLTFLLPAMLMPPIRALGVTDTGAAHKEKEAA